MDYRTIEERLQSVDAMLSVTMTTISSRLEIEDTLTPTLCEDVYFSLRGIQNIVEDVIDGIPVVPAKDGAA